MKNWVTKKLGEVYDVRDGTHDSPQYVEEGYALITSKNLKNDNLNYDNVNYITEQDYISINKRSKVDLGDILFAMIGTIGNPIVIKEEPDFAIKNVALFKVPKNQDSYFLKYYLDSGHVIDQMTKDAKGATQKFVGLGYLRNFEIPLPPLSEQQRIVTILDEVFEAITKAKANAEQNLKNAKELFESYLQNVFETKGEGWIEKKLGEICEINPKKSELKKLEMSFLVSFLPMKDLGVAQNKINPIATRELSEVMGSYTYFKDNDVLLAKVTPCFENGKLGIAKSLKNGIGFGSSEYIVFRPLSAVISEYIFYLLSSANFRNEGKKLMFGAVGLKRLSKDYVQNFSVSLPSLKAQQTIVQKLDALSLETKKLEAIYQQKISDLEELKKSVLQKAFAGELKNNAEVNKQLSEVNV